MARFCLLLLLTLASFAAVWGAVTVKTIVVGGFGSSGNSVKADLVSDGKIVALPDLPFGMSGNGVVVKGKKIYTCGGVGSLLSCYCFDIGSRFPAWKNTLSLPLGTFARPTMIVGDNIWILALLTAYVIPLDSTKKSSSKRLPMGLVVPSLSCGGGDDKTRFVIPSGGSDVWVNTDDAKPETWVKKTTSLGVKAYFRSCMIKDKEVYVVGGVAGGAYIKTAEMLNIDTDKLTALTDMMYTRQGAGMGMINDKPAVFGGFNGAFLKTVETYDAAKKAWGKESIELSVKAAFRMGYATFKLDDDVLATKA